MDCAVGGGACARRDRWCISSINAAVTVTTYQTLLTNCGVLKSPLHGQKLTIHQDETMNNSSESVNALETFRRFAAMKHDELRAKYKDEEARYMKKAQKWHEINRKLENKATQLLASEQNIAPAHKGNLASEKQALEIKQKNLWAFVSSDHF
jgi:hypothetical protein